LPVADDFEGCYMAVFLVDLDGRRSKIGVKSDRWYYSANQQYTSRQGGKEGKGEVPEVPGGIPYHELR
jgi:hypothetical protein